MLLPLKFTVGQTDDNLTTTNNDLSEFTIKFNSPIQLPKQASEYKLELSYLSIPYVTPNISSDKGNNSLVYTYSGTDYTVTFPDGIYSTDHLTSYITSAQVANGHTTTNASGDTVPYFELKFNLALGKSYIEYYDNATYPVTITFTTSSFYQVIGFLSTDTVTEDTLATNLADIAQGTSHFYMHCNQCIASYNSELGLSDILYTNEWNSTPYSYCRYPTSEESSRPVSAELRNNKIREFKFSFTDANGVKLPLTLAADSDSIVIRLNITDQD